MGDMMVDWRDKFKPICELLEPLSIAERRILMHSLAFTVLESSGVNRALSCGEHAGVPVAMLFVRGQKMVDELGRYAKTMGFTLEYELREGESG